MKNMSNKYGKYIAFGLTLFAVLACAILFYFGLDYIGSFFRALGSFLGILSPFIWGLIIAYLLGPPMSMYKNKVFTPICEKCNKKWPKLKIGEKLPKVLALIFAEISLLLVITLLIYLIVPQVYESIAAIVANSPQYFDSAYSAMDKLLQEHPVIEEYATKVFGNMTDALTSWAKNTLLPGMDNIIANITTGVYFVIKAVYTTVVGIVVSVYVLSNREKFQAHVKKLMYCIFNSENAMSISKAVKFADKTFMGFIVGRLLDAAIVGVICYICCLVLKMPYALLIAVIVGVTNIIPFFGPFIGAVPSALLILLVNPWKCVIFLIFILILKQVDGNIIGPKILGESIGINGFWVIFSIILFGGLFGFWGMLLGVPVFVIIYTVIEMIIDKKLKKKGLPSDAEEYMHLDYIDPESGEMVMLNTQEKD